MWQPFRQGRRTPESCRRARPCLPAPAFSGCRRPVRSGAAGCRARESGSVAHRAAGRVLPPRRSSGALRSLARRSLISRARALRWSSSEPSGESRQRDHDKHEKRDQSCGHEALRPPPSIQTAPAASGLPSRQPVGKLRTDAGRAEHAPHLSAFVDAGAVES